MLSNPSAWAFAFQPQLHLWQQEMEKDISNPTQPWKDQVYQ